MVRRPDALCGPSPARRDRRPAMIPLLNYLLRRSIT